MRILYRILLVLFIGGTLNAQSLSGYKLCIDPGHGGNDPANDRHITEVDFWESEGNLGKALNLREILDSLGAEVILTRTENDDSDDLALSVRAGIANSNNVDYFHSIHSNATGTANRVNFPLILYRGYSNDPVFDEARDFASVVWNEIYKAKSGVWSHHNERIYGDWTFYDWGTSGLGVLRPLSMPGTLSEGSFHDYLPEATRLKNDSYLRHEAWAIARAFLEHYAAGQLETGIVAGILRDPNESVPSSYQPISGTNDNKLPLKGIRVTLKPSGRVYDGDDFGNGYYMFDYVEPGDHTLIFEAEDYKTDSTTVTVVANESVFADYFMELVPNENAPKITASSPETGGEGLSTLTEIVVDFDIRMNQSVTQQAFTINPDVNGEFTWENNSKRMIFKPTTPMNAGGEYTVTISTSAQTLFGVNLETEYSFIFSTRSKLNLISVYPVAGDTGISKTVLVRVQYEYPIESNSLPGNVLFYDENDTFVDLIVNTSAYTKGRIEFEPRNPLEAGKEYKVILKQGISDIENVAFGEEVEVSFITEKAIYNTGQVISGFESFGEWLQPEESESTVGVDEELTEYSIQTKRVYDGENAGELKYSFNANDGVCELPAGNIYNIGTTGSIKFGVWIYGDLSGNNIDYNLSDENGNSERVYISDINWLGWKFKYLPEENLNLVGSLTLDGIVVRQTEGGSNTGTIYLDAAQTDYTTPVMENKLEPREFVLEQNYPNPFNPSTNIGFSLIEKSSVSMTVYNTLGEAVSKIINNREYSAGSHNVKWNGLSSSGYQLPSGIYFYKIDTGTFSSVRKMILIR